MQAEYEKRQAEKWNKIFADLLDYFNTIEKEIWIDLKDLPDDSDFLGICAVPCLSGAKKYSGKVPVLKSIAPLWKDESLFCG